MLCAVGLVSAPAAEARKYAAIIVDAQTGKVIHQSGADRRIFPASLTKMMTLYMVFEALDRRQLRMSTRLKVSKQASRQRPSKIYLEPGSTITVRQAISALIVKSANDVAVVVAENLGRSERNFARMMTSKARKLGMRNTVFRNASGLPNHKQVSTARDMSTLARALLHDFPHYYRLFSQTEFHFAGKTYKTHNKLLQNYPGADGMKTGYIRASGFNVATSVKRNGRRLIGVVIGGKTAKRRDRQMRKLLDRAWRDLPRIQYARVGTPSWNQRPPRKPQDFTVAQRRQDNVALARAATANPAANQAVATRSTITFPQRMTLPRRAALQQQQAMANRKPPRRPIMIEQGSRDDTVRAVAVETWGIQVGAFSRFDPAHKAVSRAARHVPHILMRTRVHIEPVETNQATLYRARMLGLTEKKARAACSHLQKKNMPCMALPPAQLAHAG